MSTKIKEEIRKRIKEGLKKQKEEDKLRKSEVIKGKLFELCEFQRAKTVMFYVSLEEEVNTKEMIDESLLMGKKVAVPFISRGEMFASLITDREKLVRGPLGIYQPKRLDVKAVDLNEIDLVAVPGLAFDEACNRLGRGKAYYDRFLRGLADRAYTVGLAFDFQVVKDLPRNSRDIPVKKLLVG